MGDFMFFSLFGETYIGDNICDNNNVISALRVAGYLLFVIKLFVPILIIAVGTFDLYKAVTGGSQEAMTKQAKKLGYRVLLGILIFFIPTIVNAILSQLTEYKWISSDIEKCQKCILTPQKCDKNSPASKCNSYMTSTECSGAGQGYCVWDFQKGYCFNK